MSRVSSIAECPRPSAPTIDDSPRPAHVLLTWIGLAAIGLLWVYLLWVAVSLKIDYFDSYDTLLNARCIASGAWQQWRQWRALGLSAFIFPWFVFQRRTHLDGLGFIASHLTAVGFWMVLLVFSFRLFRLYLSKLASVGAVLVLAFNPLLVHCAPMAKEDIPAAALMAGAGYACLRGIREHSTRWFVITGALAGLAMATRQNLLPLILALFTVSEIADRMARRRQFPQRESKNLELIRLASLFVLPLVVFFLFPILIYPRVGVSRVLAAPAFLLHDMRTHFARIEAWENEDALKNVRFLLRSTTLPIALLAFLGFMVACRRRSRGALYCSCWFAIVFLAHTFYFKHREARFLFPAFTPLYFFVGVAIEAGQRLLERTDRLYRPGLSACALGLFVAAPMVASLRECQRFMDPVYYRDFERDVSRSASRLAGDHRIWWVGPYYPLHPRDYLFDPSDDTTSLYHFGCPSMIFYSDRLIWQLRANGERLDEPRTIVQRFPEFAREAQDGDVLVINSEIDDFTSATVPLRLKPLIVCSLRKIGNSGQIGSSSSLPFRFAEKQLVFTPPH